jgi:hypothetical protein
MKVIRGGLGQKSEAVFYHRKWYRILPALITTIILLALLWWAVYQISPTSNGYNDVMTITWLATVAGILVMVVDIFNARGKCRYCGKLIRDYQPAICLEWDEESKYSAKIVKVGEVFHEKCHRASLDDKKFKMPPPFDDVQL